MMFAKNPKRPAARKWFSGLLLLLIVLAVSGCKTISFYAQALKGQYQIFAHEVSIESLVGNAKTPAKLKSRFELLQQLRVFADKELHLPVDGHYRKYVDVHRPYVVWNVQAAPEFSMQPKTWWYPMVGSLEYRGYFSHSGATNYAGYLRRHGFDTAVGGVQAYSTLGWFKDPVLNTFLFEPDSDLAEIIFHELGHQRVFARGDTDFNEAFATTVGQEGTRRWLKSLGNTAGLQQYVEHLRRNDEFVKLVMQTRAKLEALYGDQRNEEGKVKSTDQKQGVPREQLRLRKQRVFDDMKQQFAALKQKWGSGAEFDSWFDFPINNAHLNSVAAYYDLVPGFEVLLADNGGDLEKFYIAAERLANQPKKERQEWLKRNHAPIAVVGQNGVNVSP
jgi:predicted aminopeptidase